jgi:hypothetical protein
VIKPQKTVPKTLPGAVVQQYVRCGKPGCRCAQGALHGPYSYRKWREGGRQRKAYVPVVDVVEVRAACAGHRERWRRFRVMRDLGRREWSRLAGLLREGDAHG